MTILLIALIYLAFISLGLPDGLLGAGWPVMVGELDVPLSWAGIISMIISAGTILSALLSDRLTRRFGAGLVTAVSTAMTAGAMVGFALSGEFWLLCLLAVPYGLGAGAVDAALNNYVAVHYSSKYMSWLHCFWGLGATFGPYIMGWAIGAGHGWRTGYGTVGIVQIAMAALLFVTLPLWKKQLAAGEEESAGAPVGLRQALQIPGVKSVLLAFCAYCALESVAFLWSGSFLVEYRGMDAEAGANFASLFYVGLTVGRFLSGFIADRVRDENMIRLGSGVMVAGLVLLALPVGSNLPALAGLVILGLGAAPVYPSIIHSTPAHFGKENSQAIVGIQMASAYTGMTLMPPVFGLIGQHVTMGAFPWFMAIFLVIMVVLLEKVNRFCSCKS